MPEKPIFNLADLLGSGAQEESALTSLARALAGNAPPLVPPPPPPVHGKWFKDQTLQIDGYVFEGCRFDRCKLITELAIFTFKNCYISPDCSIHFSGPSLKIVRLLLHFLRLQGRVNILPNEQGLLATSNPDGTFSLE